MERPTRMAKVLCYDIETSYIITREKKWQLYDENPISREIEEDWKILCYAFCWWDTETDTVSEVEVISQRDFADYVPGVNDDHNVVFDLWQKFNLADAVIAHNGDKFDQRKVNARIAIHRLSAPSPFAQIDTRKIAKKYFGFTSNKLSDLAKFLGVEQKADAGGIATWDGCIAGDDASWDHMIAYNRQDVRTLWQIYLILRSWHQTHPSIAVMNGLRGNCDVCGSSDLIHRGTRYTNTRAYKRLRCNAPNCGHWQKGELIKT